MGEKGVLFEKKGHSFYVFFDEDNQMRCQINDGPSLPVCCSTGGVLYLFSDVTLEIDDQTISVGGVQLDDADQLRLMAMRVEREEQLKADKKKLLKRVDKWKKKVKTQKSTHGRNKYAFHEFIVGANRYRYFERCMDDGRVIINPDYKVTPEMESEGGIAVKSGDLVFWSYHFDGQGWKRIRELNKNEVLCLEIIEKFGLFCDGDKTKAGKSRPRREDRKSPKEVSVSEKTPETIVINSPVEEKPVAIDKKAVVGKIKVVKYTRKSKVCGACQKSLPVGRAYCKRKRFLRRAKVTCLDCCLKHFEQE